MAGESNPDRKDVALDDATMAAAKGMFAHLKSLSEANTTVESWLIDVGEYPVSEIVEFGENDKVECGPADYQSRAIAYFLSEAKKRPPGAITKAEIIQKLGCAESTLSKGRAPTLDALMQAHKSQASAGTIRRGTKDVDGNLEAID